MLTAILKSGGFDFPPASANSNHPSLDDSRPLTIDPRVTSRIPVTQHSDRERESERRRMIVDNETQQYLASRRGIARHSHHQNQSAANQNFPTSAIRPHILGSRLRRRVTATHAGTSINPHRNSLQFGPTSFGLDLPEPSLPRRTSVDMNLAEYSGEAEVNRRRKRPKLGDEFSTIRSRGFRYDWKGRAAPGRLKMEIHECNGGLHSGAAAQDCGRYKQENILVNDQSVYCTEANKCNIIMRHGEEACFSVTKLVIKAPGSLFTAPYVFT